MCLYQIEVLDNYIKLQTGVNVKAFSTWNPSDQICAEPDLIQPSVFMFKTGSSMKLLMGRL